MAKKRGMSRRDFFRLAWLGSFGLFLTGFGGASLALLWPSLRGGFGSRVTLPDKLDDIKAQLESGQTFNKYYADAKTYIVKWDPLPGQEALYKDIATEGLLAVYQKCAHLGCRVPPCETSNWFECPCHGSRYNKAGEYQFGPAPRGLDHFPITVNAGNVVVDTSARKEGPPRGTDTIGQAPAGPHC